MRLRLWNFLLLASIIAAKKPQVRSRCCSKLGVKEGNRSLPATLNLDGNEDRIVGGCEPCPGEFPWVIGLFGRGRFRPFCGGSLISDKWILTAAHCVVGKRCSSLQVHLGDHNVTATDEGEVVMDVCNIAIHDFYHSVFFDIALIELCEPVQYSHVIQPIKCATKTEYEQSKHNLVTVAGWGSLKERHRGSEVLMKVEVPMVDFDTCKSSYNWLSDGMICAGNMTHGGIDSCQGDSGGPLWTTLPGSKEPFQTGIVSNGRGCARAGSPGVYTDVSNYYDWIHDTMADTKRTKQCH